MKEKPYSGQSFVGVGQEQMASPKEFTRPELGEEDRRELTVKILTMVLELIQSKDGVQETCQECVTVEVEKLNIEWQKTNPGKKFKDYKCGTFKSFLKNQCDLKESITAKDQFKINPSEIEEKLRDVNSKNKVLVSSNNNEANSYKEAPLASKPSATPPKHIDESKDASVVGQLSCSVQELDFNGNRPPNLAAFAGPSKRRTHKKVPETRVSQPE